MTVATNQDDRSHSSSSSRTTSSSTSTSVLTSMEAAVDAHAILQAHAQSLGPVSAPPNASLLYEPYKNFTAYITLGPVIGLVTDTTARVLIETSVSGNVTCFLTDKHGVQHGSWRHVPKHRPFVFVFEGLKPDTYYRVSFDIPVPGLVESGFATLPREWNLKKKNGKVAAVAQNAFYSNQEEIPHNLDLWRSLYRKIKHGKCNYVFHLGDNVYVDSDRYKQNGVTKSYVGVAGFNPYYDAFTMLQGSPQSQWSKLEHHVIEMFREAYRRTWNYPTTKQCLANCPNLMILNEHEIESGLGRYNQIRDPAGLEEFLLNCAYEVYNEYCRALFEDYPSVSQASQSLSVGQAYHFHSLGDVGIMFLDCRAATSVHRTLRDEAYPLLGSRQWEDIEFALSPGGYLDNCRMLMVCVASPVALCGEQGFLTKAMCSQQQQTALLNSWNSPANMPESSLLLHRLFDWRAAQPGRRNVCLLAGGGALGGITDIMDLRYNRSDQRLARIKQISSGPIGNKFEISAFSERPSLLTAKCGINGLGANHQFKHYNLQAGRSFALIEMSAREHDEPIFEVKHYSSNAAGRRSNKPVGSSYISGGWGWGGNPTAPMRGAAGRMEGVEYDEESDYTSSSSEREESTNRSSRKVASKSSSYYSSSRRRV